MRRGRSGSTLGLSNLEAVGETSVEEGRLASGYHLHILGNGQAVLKEDRIDVGDTRN